MRRFSEKKSKESEKEETKETDLASMLSLAMDRPEMRTIAVYGDINEERCAEAVYGLLTLDLSARSVVTENKGTEEEKTVEVVEPIEFYVSSYGGQATEMFAVYDVMRDVRERTPVITYGIGKVMSAGVLLLAAGTKGQRRIGKNCRVMIHGVVAGQHGHIADIENEFTEVKSTQKMYIDALVEETDMTQRYIKKLMDKKTNVYLDAAEAVNLGIADIII
jgi:ATP-dependent Clp endopeptidase proteolytic subunit ClpP